MEDPPAEIQSGSLRGNEITFELMFTGQSLGYDLLLAVNSVNKILQEKRHESDCFTSKRI